ncbi:MAG: penicillin-binding protein [Candidatus Magasanikiibacteriota bacterium]
MSEIKPKRRVYGYTNNHDEKINKIVHGYNKPVQTKINHPNNKKWLKIAVLPFLVIGWIFKFLWFLWTKRPRLSQSIKKKLRAKLGWVILTCIVIGFLLATILVAWASKDLPDPDKLTDRKVAQSTKIYDRTGEHILYEVFADQKRTMVTLDKIPKNLVNGVIATEDSQFYEHHGVRITSFIRAVVYGVFTSKQIGGTSTLTQQLVKNAILTTERSYIRKLKEIILSLRLEQKYSKDQILQIYFNEIPYGSTNYGVQSAAHSYFGKDVSELNLQECATLAGLPQAPSRFLGDPEALKQRRDFVLGRMFAEGYITEEEKNKAQAEPITLEKRFGEIKAPHFVLYVRQQLVDMYGEQTVDTGGLKVYTTLDWGKQESAEKAVKEQSEKLFEAAKANNASLVALDPKTGQVLAMVGSRDFYDDSISGQFNVATLGKRQPGSSFKPIIYTAAFEKGYTPDTLLWDVKTNFAVSGNSYEPQNYDLKERGPVRMREALQGSLNIPAVQTLYLVGAKKGVEFAERLGYTTLSEGEFGLSLVLGGGEVKLIEHTNAFAVFANNGVKQNYNSIMKVEDNDGGILYEWKQKKGERILDEKISATISNVLSDDEARASVFGAGGVLTLPDRKVAVKTGTTNNYVDAWTVGYTPNLVAGVWVGRTDNKPMNKGDGGSRLAAPIWKQFMVDALKDMPIENFPDMPANDAQKPILRGSIGGGITLPIDKITGKIATSSTPQQYIVERKYLPAHSILYYVNKDDPRGDPPQNPSDDPQYAIWEQAIQDWVARKKAENPDWSISFEEPPTEYDDLHSLEQAPTLEIIYPQVSSTLYSRQLDTDIRATAERGVSKVSYKIDDKNIATIKDYPFNLSYNLREFAPGWHTLTVTVEDDIGNRRQEQVPFNLDAEEEPPAIYFSEKDITLQASDFPRTFFMNHFRINEISAVAIYKRQNDNNTLIASVNDFSNLFNNQVMFRWDETPAPGEYELIAEIKLKDGSVRESGRLHVVIE